jgi:hypothetical protein
MWLIYGLVGYPLVAAWKLHWLSAAVWNKKREASRHESEQAWSKFRDTKLDLKLDENGVSAAAMCISSLGTIVLGVLSFIPLDYENGKDSIISGDVANFLRECITSLGSLLMNL